MKNHLASIEVSLRSIAKRYKTVKFSIGVAILFLMLGVGAFSEEINETQANETPTREEIASSRENLKNSIGNLQSKIDSAREENSKSLKGLKLELIQLMEQGDQVVKSPWASWQFGANYMYSKWNGTYKGIGDKAEKYPFEGVFVRGNWWENNVSPNSKTYERLEKSSNPNSSLSNRRQNLNYGLVNTVPVVDKGVPFIIEPVININTPPLPNLNINPVAINPTVAFSIPDVETVVFTPTKLPDIKPNVFNPPALDEVSIGFSQDMVGAQFYLEPNVIVNNANAAANTSGTTVTINDDGFSVNNPFTWEGKKGNMGRDGSGTVAGTWTFDQVDPQPGQTYTDARSGSIVNNANSAYLGYRGYVNYRTGTPVSPQTVFSFTQYQQQDNLKYGQAIDTTITGEWTLINNTTNPHNRGAGGPYKPPTNTVRFMSVNGTTVYSYYDPLNVTFNGTLNLYGRSKENSLSTGKPHMTVGIEQQAAGAKQSTFVNIGVINLEKGDAKNSTQYGRYLIGMTSMVEDYAQYQPTTGNSVGQRGTTPYPKIIYKPWETAMINKGTINVKSIDSIGMDFSEFNFNKEANLGGNATKKKAWDNKGSLNVYMKVGNINVSSTDPGIYQEVSGSYGIRVPNLFAPGVSENLDATRRNEDTRAIYYDETVIDGEGGQITLTGSHNTGVSISKIIRGSGLHTIANPYTKTETITTTEGSQDVYEGHISVYDYQTGKGADGNGLGGKTTDRANLDNTGRTLDDLIGNIYNLNIVVDGKENVGFLRKSDYMKGNYDADIQTLAQKDFVIKDSHIASIDFANNTDGGVLFRTDRYGIDLAKNLTVNPGDAYIGDTDPNKDESEWLNKRFNIVMLANGGENHADTVVPKVRNSGKITVSAGGRNIIGLMAYKGAKAVSDKDITITNSDNSIGMVLTGTNTSNKISSGTSSKKISVTGKNATGIYNNGSDYEMTAGSISVNGNKAIAVYASKANNRQAITKLGAGTISASGDGSIGLYADGGSDIELNGTTINIGDKGLFFFGKAENSDEAQLKLTGNATVNVASGGTAFYVKKSNSGSPLGSIRHAGSTGTLTVNLANGSTLMVAEGNGGTASPERISSLSSVGSSSVTGINIVGTAGQYVPYKALRVPLLVDRNSNFDSAADTYLNSEFSSSSVTIDTGVTVSGSGALTSPTKLVKKSKVAIAQKNTNSTNRNDVILTNNGTINFTGNDMAGIVGEYSEINNNSIINVTGTNSTGIISANGSLATNNGTINIGNGGTGLAGINYLGVTDTPASSIPTYGNQSIDLVHNGSIVSTGNSAAIGVLASDLKSVVDKNGTTLNITNANAAKITLGNNSLIDVSSAAGGVGVYSKGLLRSGVMANVTDSGSKIKINANGIGLYLEGTELSATAGSIEAINNTTAKGIYTDSNVNSAKNITLLGDKSIAIHNFGKNSQYTTDININNSGNIKLGNSSNRNDPSIGIYTKYANVNHQGTIEAGNRSLGIFSETPLSLTSGGSIKVGNEGLGIYKKQGTATINGAITTGNSATAVYADNNVTINNNSTNISVGDNSFGFIVLNNGTNNYNSSATTNFTMGSKSVYLYKTGANGVANTATTVRSNGISSTAFYAKDGGKITNTGNVDFSNSIGSVGAYASAGEVYNSGNITIGRSDIENNYYAIGMATQNGGRVVNNLGATINVTGNYGIGMFAEGAGSRAENYGTIDISGNGELIGAYGMYLNNGAYGLNQGTIRTGRYSNDSQKSDSFGVAVLNGATLENRGTIDIDMANSYGIYIKNGIIKNYGTINISGTGSVGIRNKDGKDENGNRITEADLAAANINASNGANAYVNAATASTQPAVAGNTSISPTGVVTINGKVVPVHDLTPGPNPIVDKNYAFSNVGIYVDTLGRTNPINWVDGFNPSIDNDLIIGAEAAELSTSKAIKIGKNIMSPYLNQYQSLTTGSSVTLNAISGSLTWTAQPISGPSGLPEEVIMAKIPYTDFVTKQENAWNFADGLEQRYGVEPVGSREKEVFNKLNSIGKNERVLLTQAYDEMMGHQYANTQQRVYTTGSILNTEFDYLRNEWRTASKDSNKIKTFGNKGEYKTDTAGVIDYKYNAYGVAYVHESEDIKLGRGIGWYTGIVENTFKFKDIGNSKEKQLQAKVGLLKSVPFDDNNSLNWTISGDIFVGYNKMHRKFLVVNEIFNAKSRYYTYGIGLKNELAKEFRLSESFVLRPYGALRLEYGKISKIREKSGEIKLEVKNTDYISVKPELGVQLGFKHFFGNKLFTTSLGVAYENELGRIANVKNKGRVADTSADWFNIRGDKEDRRGNVKTDLIFGIDNTRVGVTANVGYDTKGENLRGGVGLRVIF
ncbi:autotransporter-associated N-terminal domain-containing protein [Fusobacterium hwasookii]|uniref:autotransporter-associated N-terminal domain-containing protein n=1 Tax=Fusobacterium hwasookii TaxID=1583098 RepID=UPI001C6F342B|nr:autotransporter-associated N-terminal domain-containing protein [Fusobacterium hwasookii]QYR54503.1 autotransporter-associated N-terminal domain-containing protein [Fusobacterium hwasookii]